MQREFRAQEQELMALQAQVQMHDEELASKKLSEEQVQGTIEQLRLMLEETRQCNVKLSSMKEAKEAEARETLKKIGGQVLKLGLAERGSNKLELELKRLDGA